MAWAIDDGEVILRGRELPQADIDGDATLTLRLQLVPAYRRHDTTTTTEGAELQ